MADEPNVITLTVADGVDWTLDVVVKVLEHGLGSDPLVHLSTPHAGRPGESAQEIVLGLDMLRRIVAAVDGARAVSAPGEGGPA